MIPYNFWSSEIKSFLELLNKIQYEAWLYDSELLLNVFRKTLLRLDY